MVVVLNEEMAFYRSYDWSLQTFLSFKQILDRLSLLLKEDLRFYPEWCRREHALNVYMLSCAALDILDDYFGMGIYNFEKARSYMPVLSLPIKLGQEGSILLSRLKGSLRGGKLRNWRKHWAGWVICACNGVIGPDPSDAATEMKIKEQFEGVVNFRFPASLLETRIRIPAAYRSQDLAHIDFLSLGEKYCKNHCDFKTPIVVIGMRTAGSYIAPLLCAYLQRKGFAQVNFMTLRPRAILSPWDERQVKEAAQKRGRYILADEPPSTGKTIAQCIDILERFSVKREDVTVMLPVHPAGGDWLGAPLKHSLGEAEIITLEPEEWFKEKELHAERFLDNMRPYLKELGFDGVALKDSEKSRQINAQLSDNPGKEYHVRLKRVVEIIAEKADKSKESLWILGKSTGWGWLGYHGALIGEAVKEYVPHIYGLRNGILYQGWVNENGGNGENHREENHSLRIADYISRRVEKLKIEEDPTKFLAGYRESGLQSLAMILSLAFGPRVSKLKRGWVRKLLENDPCLFPAVTDSRMPRKEWVGSDGSLLKTDFEHHGFSKTASHNIVDPAYDIAAAILAFNLQDEEREGLIQNYIEKTGDHDVRRRLILYEILAGTEGMKEAVDKINKISFSSQYGELNLDYIKAWSFLVSESSKYSGSLCAGAPVRDWKAPWFVMDIDDVLDKNIFGFPSTTANGVLSLSLLRAHNVCSLINTARSFEEIKGYCRNYGFAGGIGEYGSVIWDDMLQKEEILISNEAREELSLIREALAEMPGIFVNPFYQHSIRAYSYDRDRTIPIPEATIGEIFRKKKVSHLKAHRTYIDVAICDKDVNKGKALLKLREMKENAGGPIGAIGDTESDFPMLIVADKGYLVINSTADLQSKVKGFGVKLLGSSFQSGLLEGVKLYLHGERTGDCKQCKETMKHVLGQSGVMWELMKIADMSEIQHWRRAFDRNVLEIFRE